jgi:hypothetical protein
MTGIIERLGEHHEPQEEVGGFWSYYSLWFKSQHGDKRQAYVVEPDPNHIEPLGAPMRR